MWSCPNCKKLNESDTIFCSDCGANRFNVKYKDYLSSEGIINSGQNCSSQHKRNNQISAKLQETNGKRKICRHCGLRLQGDALFCSNCGEKLTALNNDS